MTMTLDLHLAALIQDLIALDLHMIVIMIDLPRRRCHSGSLYDSRSPPRLLEWSDSQLFQHIFQVNNQVNIQVNIQLNIHSISYWHVHTHFHNPAIWIAQTTDFPSISTCFCQEYRRVVERTHPGCSSTWRKIGSLISFIGFSTSRHQWFARG